MDFHPHLMNWEILWFDPHTNPTIPVNLTLPEREREIEREIEREKCVHRFDKRELRVELKTFVVREQQQAAK
jgi:hypothetical protein